MLAARGKDLDGMTAVVSGSGNVAIYAIEKLQQEGVKVVACSDSDGVVYDPNGLHLGIVKHLKEVERCRVSDYVAARGGDALFSADASAWDIPAMWRCPVRRRTSWMPT